MNSQPQHTAKLEIQEVTKRFRVDGKLVVALEDVSLALEEREFATLVGPSGCGKSTLLNVSPAACCSQTKAPSGSTASRHGSDWAGWPTCPSETSSCPGGQCWTT